MIEDKATVKIQEASDAFEKLEAKLEEKLDKSKEDKLSESLKTLA